MVTDVLLLAGAVGAYSLGAVLQAGQARRTDLGLSLSPRLVVGLARRLPWLAGFALGVLGWAFEAAALAILPVAFVLPGMALGLVVLLALSRRILHEPVGRRELAGALAITAGIALVAREAPAPGAPVPSPAAWAAGLSPLLAAVALPYLGKLRGGTPGWITSAASAGSAYAVSGLTTALLARWVHRGEWLPAVAALAATALAGGAGLVSETSALQTGRVTAVVPVLVLMDSFVPAALAPLVFREPWPPGWASAVMALGLGLAVAGTLALSGSGRLAGLRAAGA